MMLVMCVCARTPQHTIEGRRDIRGGRLASDRRAAGNLSSGTAFRSLAFSADGSFLIAGAADRVVPDSRCSLRDAGGVPRLATHHKRVRSLLFAWTKSSQGSFFEFRIVTAVWLSMRA